MRKQIILTLGILMIASVMALYAGEPYKINLTEEFDYYSIVGNSTPIDLDVTQVGLEVTIIPNKYTKNETFSIIFFNKEKETITITNTIYTGGGGGGGSSKTKIIYKNSTKNIPIYTDVIKEVPVEVKGDTETIYNEAEFKWWPIIISFIIGAIIMLTIVYFLNKDEAQIVTNEQTN